MVMLVSKAAQHSPHSKNVAANSACVTPLPVDCGYFFCKRRNQSMNLGNPSLNWVVGL